MLWTQGVAILPDVGILPGIAILPSVAVLLGVATVSGITTLPGAHPQIHKLRLQQRQRSRRRDPDQSSRMVRYLLSL